MKNPTLVSRRAFLGYTAGLGAAGLLPTRLLSGRLQAADDVAPRDAWQIGCYTRPWSDLEYREAFDAVAEAGFKYVGLMTTRSPNRLVMPATTTVEEARQIGEEAKQRGLRIVSNYGGGIGVGKSLEEGIADMKRLIDACHAAGCPSLLMGGIGNENLFPVYFKAVAETCDYAAEKGVAIVIKPHGGLNATGPQLRECIKTVGHDNFRLWYDPGNIYYYSEGALNPVDDAATVDGLVTGMCVKDFTMTVEDEKPVRKVAITPGTGKVDFPAVLARLKQGGFTGGPLVVECVAPSDDPKAVLDEARKARVFLEKLVAA
ncbi:MAG: sugar phosphate isomerase/epimerase family protein [Patescibacteria group bacterium]|nr:sugar phosphate isomerase/epimerase family protein [Patescibacteria group bacterium]